MKRYGPWLLGLLFFAVWIGLLHFLAVDRCVDSGGAVAAGGLSCETATDQLVSLFSYANIFDTILSAVLAAIPVGVITAIAYSNKRST